MSDRAARRAFWRRVQQRLDALELSRNRFGELVGASSGTVSGWFTAHKMPRTGALLRFPRMLKCSGHWLLTGEGPVTSPTGKGRAEYDAGYRQALLDGRAALVDLSRGER